MAMAAIILAGGLSQRMGGGDKALRVVGGQTLLDHVIRRLTPQADTILLNANGDPSRFAAFGLEVRPDGIPGHAGPLAGVLTGLEWAREKGCDRLLSVASDTPLLPPDLARRLAAEDAAIVQAASGGRHHPVMALWRVSLAGDLRRFLAAGERKVGLFAQGAKRVEWPVQPFDPFLNVNTPEDLAAIQALLAAG